MELHRQQDAQRRALARRRAREQFKAKSPPPVEGRKHIEVQTELYLESITGEIIFKFLMVFASLCATGNYLLLSPRIVTLYVLILSYIANAGRTAIKN